MRRTQRRFLNQDWHTRLTHDGPYQTVRCIEGDRIQIGFMPGNKKDGFGVSLPRADAKLLARRIEQCLKATVKP